MNTRLEESLGSLYRYTHLYGPQIVLLTLLSAITIYRREMSCNHVYVQDEDNGPRRDNSAASRTTNDGTTGRSLGNATSPTPPPPQREIDWDAVLEGAGKWGSGEPLLGVLFALWSILATETSDETTVQPNSTGSTRPTTIHDLDTILDGVSEWGSGEPLLGLLLNVWRPRSSPAQDTSSPNNHGVDMHNGDEYNDDPDSCHDNDCKTNDKMVVGYQGWQVDDTEELLEGAGNYCSGVCPVVRSLWSQCFARRSSTCSTASTLSSSYSRRRSSLDVYLLSPYCPLTHDLPADVQVQIFSYLHPKDVVAVASVNHACNLLVDTNEHTAQAVWKTLWERDYAWIVNEWPVGIEARWRSTSAHAPYSKIFYFEFGLSYLNYVLAGQNSYSKCLVGIHGDIYDVTDFLDTHPGSPDSMLAEAGKDATDYFEDIGHSAVARRKSRSLCVVVDSLCRGGCGLHLVRDEETALRLDARVPRKRRIHNHRQPATLSAVKADLEARKEHFERKRIPSRHLCHALGKINPYYDPFNRQWKAWYTDSVTFEPVFYQ